MTEATPLDSILIADDDAAFASTLALFLTDQGFHCEHVPDATQAIAALERGSFSLLISDIGMPGNDNLELVQSLAGKPDRPRIILLTGQPSIPTAVKAVGLPITAYLTKPPDLPGLLQLVRQALADDRASRSLAASRQRLQTWADDIGRIQTLLQRSPQAEAGGYFQSYLALTVTNLVTSLGDLASMIEALDATGTRRQHRETAALVKAVQETITVLEKTRRTFQSKDLGTLRKKLEQLLSES